jgi:hypothetical protein
MSDTLNRLFETQPSHEQADGLFVFVSSLGAVVREMPLIRQAFLDGFDRALAQHLASQEYTQSTHEFAGLLRETLEVCLATMDASQRPPH